MKLFIALCLLCALPACGPVLLVYNAHQECLLPAYVDSFGELARSSCATDAQWQAAQLQDECQEGAVTHE